MIKFYIAFSIHGTNQFKVAEKQVLSEDSAHNPLWDFAFAAATPRRTPRPDDGIKLHWSKLNKKDGTPHTDKGWVTKRFNELVKMGWKIVPAKPH